MPRAQANAALPPGLQQSPVFREFMTTVVDFFREHQLDDALEESSSTNELKQYTYSELDGPRKIRLLSLRSAGTTSAEIECELTESSLDESPEYEALSWSWGGESWDRTIRLSNGGHHFKFDVPSNLVAALRALRDRTKNRVLWIDAICIDQESPDEKNRQVPMMADIYGQAKSVCVWIGEGNEDSKTALDFIKEEVLKLQKFDELCENENASYKWRAMLDVMKSSWFSRRWVIQEIALARTATIHCGNQTISWKDFSDAVQLFVEVETATHRLSDVMKKDPQFYHVPGWFEYVSKLGASLLVDATGNLFRRPKTVVSPSVRPTVQEPMNSPLSPTSVSNGNHVNGADQRGDSSTAQTEETLQSTKIPEAERLLSLEYLVSSMTVFQAMIPHDTIYSLLAIAKDAAPSPRLRKAKNAKPLPGQDQLKKFGAKFDKRKPYPVDYQQPLVDVCQGFIAFCIRQSDPDRALDIICRPWAPMLEDALARERKQQTGHREPRHIRVKEEFGSMPSWVPSISGAAHSMFAHASGELKMGRQNADTLVGLPGYTQRNYSAAGTREMEERVLRFKKYNTHHYSMFVSGFVCDKVRVVCERSQSGNIPDEWIEQGRWKDITEDPPEELWRTLVADRGTNGRNPPTYYARACKESIHKGLASGSLNTQELIEHGRCSVVAEFFRRVQSVIWNRSLMRTENDTLGIVNKNVQSGDLICVLYGCTVPVILRRRRKSEAEMKMDEEEHEKDLIKAANLVSRIWRSNTTRRLQRHGTKNMSRSQSLPLETTQSAWADKANLTQTPEKLSPSTEAPKDPGAQSPRPDPPPKPPTLASPPKPKSKGDIQVLNGAGNSKPNEPQSGNATSQANGSAVPDPSGSRRKVTTFREAGKNHLNSKAGDDAEKAKTQQRKRDERKYWYEFIGECYVYGMMDGEAIAYQNAKQIPAQRFEMW